MKPNPSLLKSICYGLLCLPAQGAELKRWARNTLRALTT
jgi:hypothetical protein